MTATHSPVSNSQITDKSIHLLNKCLDHQRHRFDQARMRAHQAAMHLRTQTMQLENLSYALEDYKQRPVASKPMSETNQFNFRRLLLDVKDLQMEQVKREEKTFHSRQEEALKEQHKIKTMEKVLVKLYVRKQKQDDLQQQREDDKQASADYARKMSLN